MERSSPAGLLAGDLVGPDLEPAAGMRAPPRLVACQNPAPPPRPCFQTVANREIGEGQGYCLKIDR